MRLVFFRLVRNRGGGRSGMKISLIGMSGSGKTYWAKKLKAKGFKYFCCDDLIEEKLGDELKQLGYAGIKEVASWMGQPFDVRYSERSKKYLHCEKEVMNETFEALEHIPNIHDVVIDTTGSVIYTDISIMKKLSELTKVVYLQIPKTVQEEMYRLYLKDPKPVIWGSSFSQKNGETNMDALRRCYPKLLDFRIKKYEEIADIILNYQMLRNNTFGIEDFIEVVS